MTAAPASGQNVAGMRSAGAGGRAPVRGGLPYGEWRRVSHRHFSGKGRRQVKGRQWRLRLLYLAARLLWRMQRPATRGWLKRLTAGPAELMWRVSDRRWVVAPLRLGIRLANKGLLGPSRIVFGLYRWVLVSAIALYAAAGRLEYSLATARVLNLIFRDLIRDGRPPFCRAYVHELFRAGLYARICREIKYDVQLEDNLHCRYLGQAFLMIGDAGAAKMYLRRAARLSPRDDVAWRYLGRAHLAEGNACAAAIVFRRSVRLERRSVMAHQNYAGHYDIAHYDPLDWELARAGELLIFDNLGRHAEDLFLAGRFEDSYRFYRELVLYQNKLRARRELDASVVARLAKEFPAFDPALPVRILPYEWVTQFGHIALLDAYYKMTRLGRYPEANYLLLAPPDKTVNESYLRYWERYFCVVRDPDLVRELFPWQRYFGDGFMVAPVRDSGTIPWTLAAAMAQCQWAEERRAPLLRLSDDDNEFGRRTLAALGVPEDAWYAVLHVREGGFYLEGIAGMSRHRNAAIGDYVEAVRAITDRGGWVIRMGDPTMTPLPAMPSVVDYVHSPAKSPRMDVFLLATSRFAIGTTSGLTTVCQSFGTEMLLVNCISNDWQLWSAGTDFIPKIVCERKNGAPLKLRDTYRQPLQGMLINSAVLNRAGYEVLPNTADEITEAVRYKLDLLDGRRRRPSESDAAMLRYRAALKDNPYMFGAARPVLPFLERHPELL